MEQRGREPDIKKYAESGSEYNRIIGPGKLKTFYRTAQRGGAFFFLFLIFLRIVSNCPLWAQVTKSHTERWATAGRLLSVACNTVQAVHSERATRNHSFGGDQRVYLLSRELKPAMPGVFILFAYHTAGKSSCTAGLLKKKDAKRVL